MSRRGDNIHKRKDGRWEGRYKVGSYENGKTKYNSVYGKTYSEVKTKLLATKTCHETKKTGNTKSLTCTFSEILFIWVTNNKLRYKRATEHKYTYLIEKHIVPELGALPISQIDSTIINSFLDKKAAGGRLDHKGGLSPSYIKTISFIIQSAITFAERERYCAPMNSIISKPVIRKRELNLLNKSEQYRLEAYLTTSLDCTRLGILICMYTGLRLGEICALTWDDIDLDNGIIHILVVISTIFSPLSRASVSARAGRTSSTEESVSTR